MSAQASAQQRRLRADAARNRQLLIDAAEELFAARGLDVTLDEIARRAGVNVATAYRHFANKHELARAYLQRGVDRVVEIAERAAADPDPAEGLAGFLRGCLAVIADNRGLVDVLTRAYGTEWFDQLHERITPLIEDLVEGGRRTGALRPDLGRTDVGVLLRMLSSVIDIDPADRELPQRYLSVVLAGLRPSDVPLTGRPPTEQQLRDAPKP